MNNNLATVAAIYEAFGKGDIPHILAHLADTLGWEEWADNSAQKAGVPWLQLRRDKEGVLEFFKIAAGMNVTDFQVLSLMAGANQVAAEIVIEVGMPGAALHYRDEELHLWTFDEAGKVIRLRHYTDTAKHIAAWKG